MRVSQLAVALVLVLSGHSRAETESCRRVTAAQANLAVQHLKTGGALITWCDSCTPASKPSPSSPVKDAAVRQEDDKSVVLVNGRVVELRDTFVKLADGSFRRVASLIGCEVSAPDRVGGAFDDGKLRSEWLKKPPRAGTACDTKAALVQRLASQQEFSVPAELALKAVRYNATGSEADWESIDGRYGLSVSFADDYFEDQPTSEGPDEEKPRCGAKQQHCLARRFNLRRRQVHMSFSFPPGELELCRPQAERMFARMRSSL